MALTENGTQSARLTFWKDLWVEHQLGFHKPVVNEVMKKHMESAGARGAVHKVFVPLCGKTLDMKWLSDEGYNVVGVDGVRTALEEFFTDHGMEWLERDAPAFGPDHRILQTTQGNIKLYPVDIMRFNSSIEGQFGFIWDRAAMVAVNREDTKQYARVMKDILSPGGSILLESVEYDVNIMAEYDDTPPPHPMLGDEIQSVYEPECTVKLLETRPSKLKDKDILLAYYLITKLKE